MKLRTLFAVAVGGVAAVAGYAFLRRLGRRSGVAPAELSRALPGDDLVEQPHLLADRATIIDAPPEQIWPWLVQLGKERGGWYMPAVLERVLPRAAQGARRIDPQYQTMAVGDIVPDYGPGSGTFKVMVLDPPHVLVYYTVRQPSAGWTWPERDDPLPADALVLSWALVIDELGAGHSRLHVRLRANQLGWLRSPVMALLAGTLDFVTVALMFRGLKERLRRANGLPGCV